MCVMRQERIRTGGLSKSVNSVKFKTSSNLLPVLKIVTRTAQLYIDIRKPAQLVAMSTISGRGHN